jgi:hypothetical protein
MNVHCVLHVSVNEHAMQLDRASIECRREYEILIEAIVNSQKCILQPHITTPAQILKQMKASQSDLPSDLTLPIPVSAAYQNLVLRIIDIDAFLKDDYLVYVIRLPLTNSVKSVYHVLPLPIKIKDTVSKFTFILPEREYLLMDVVKQYYTRLRVDEFNDCKVIINNHYVCKQNYPVQITHLVEECEAEMLQPIRIIPASCSQIIIELQGYYPSSIP